MHVFDPTAAASDMTPEWVEKALAAGPWVKNEKTGNLTSCIARLSFPHLFKAQVQDGDDGDRETFNAGFLFPINADLTMAKEAATACAAEKWGAASSTLTLHSPFKDQGEKAARYAGFVPGAIVITATSTRKPFVVDQRGVPISESKGGDGVELLPPGCWVRLVTNPFAWERRNRQGAVVKRGVTLGLNGVIYVADDQKFGGGASNPQAELEGLAAIGDLGPAVNPQSLF